MWMSWRQYAGKGILLDPEMEAAEMAAELVQCMALRCAVIRNKEAPMAGKPVAVSLYHEQWVGLSLPIVHVRARVVRQGVKRVHVVSGNQQRLRRPLTWGILVGMDGAAKSEGWRVL